MDKQKNIPVLRFPEFTEVWKTKSISNVLSIGSGRDYKHLGNGEIPVFGTGGLMTSVDEYLHDGETVCIGRKGTIDKPMYFNGKLWTVDTLFYTHSFKESTPKFIYNIFQRINWKMHNEASGVPSLSKAIIDKILINLPNIPEQTKIASFLTAVDDKLNNLKQKKSLLEQYKKGIMQQMFSQKIRFKDDNGKGFPEWEEKKLGDVLFEHLNKNIKNVYTEVFSVAKHKGVINQIEHLGRSYSATDITNYKIVYNDDLVYTKSPTSEFPFGIIKQNMTTRTGVVSPLYGVFRPQTKAIGFILHNYFNSWINTYNYLNPLVQKGAKNTMNINNNDFLNGAYILLPVSEIEQTKIANFLSGINDKLNHTNNQIEKMQQWKKGLLQSMFC